MWLSYCSYPVRDGQQKAGDGLHLNNDSIIIPLGMDIGGYGNSLYLSTNTPIGEIATLDLT